MSRDTAAFGDVLRRLRIAAALSQEALAERAGVSPRGISDLERGARRTPHLITVRLLADGLALSPPERRSLLAAARPELLPESQAGTLAGSVPLPVPLTPLLGRERAVPDFPDGVVFVSLAPLADPAFVASAIAQRLSVPDAAQQPLAARLKMHLADKRL